MARFRANVRGAGTRSSIRFSFCLRIFVNGQAGTAVSNGRFDLNKSSDSDFEFSRDERMR